VLKWLEDPQELASWRALARVMVRLIDPKRTEADPVNDLTGFLKQDAFDLDLRRLTLEIPDRLDKRPSDDLTVYLEIPGEDQAKKLRFEITDKQRDAQRGVTQYLLRASKQQTIAYHPGDVLWAALPLRDVDQRDQEWSLTWARGHSELYQFERLIRPPRLRPKDQPAAEGTIVEDVRISVTQGSLPPVPDLLPVVKLDRR
jgi:hypothetical protein